MAGYSYEEFAQASQAGGGSDVALERFTLRDVFNMMVSLNIWVPLLLVSAFVACVAYKVHKGKPLDEAIKECADIVKTQDQAPSQP